ALVQGCNKSQQLLLCLMLVSTSADMAAVMRVTFQRDRRQESPWAVWAWKGKSYGWEDVVFNNRAKGGGTGYVTYVRRLLSAMEWFAPQGFGGSFFLPALTSETARPESPPQHTCPNQNCPPMQCRRGRNA